MIIDWGWIARDEAGPTKGWAAGITGDLWTSNPGSSPLYLKEKITPGSGPLSCLLIPSKLAGIDSSCILRRPCLLPSIQYPSFKTASKSSAAAARLDSVTHIRSTIRPLHSLWCRALIPSPPGPASLLADISPQAQYLSFSFPERSSVPHWTSVPMTPSRWDYY